MSDYYGNYAQAAARLEVSESHVRNLVKKGQLPFFRLGRRTLFAWHRLDLYLDSEAARGLADTTTTPDELAQKRGAAS